MARYKPKRKQAERCQNCCARLNGYVEIYQGTFINFTNRQPLALGHQYQNLNYTSYLLKGMINFYLITQTLSRCIHLSYVLDILLVIFSIL